MKIIVTAKSNYGVTAYYPTSEAAKVLARIAGTKTLTMAALRHASELGTVEIDGDSTLRLLVNGNAFDHNNCALAA